MGSSRAEKQGQKAGSGSDNGSGDEGDAPGAPAQGGLLARFTQRFRSNKPEARVAEPAVDFLEEEPEMYVDRDGADSDTNAEAATLFARRPLVRPSLRRGGAPCLHSHLTRVTPVQTLEGVVDRSAQNSLLMSMPCAPARRFNGWRARPTWGLQTDRHARSRRP